MGIEKDWINSLGLMFMSYATITDGVYSELEKHEVLVQHQEITKHILSLIGEVDKIPYSERVQNMYEWYIQLKNTNSLKSEFQYLIESIPSQDFWSDEISILVCKALYMVANADNEVVKGEADVLTDLMTKWNVSIEDIEDQMQ